LGNGKCAHICIRGLPHSRNMHNVMHLLPIECYVYKFESLSFKMHINACLVARIRRSSDAHFNYLNTICYGCKENSVSFKINLNTLLNESVLCCLDCISFDLIYSALESLFLIRKAVNPYYRKSQCDRLFVNLV